MKTLHEFLYDKRSQKLLKKIKKQIKRKEKVIKDTEKKIDQLINNSKKNYDYLNLVIK